MVARNDIDRCAIASVFKLRGVASSGIVMLSLYGSGQVRVPASSNEAERLVIARLGKVEVVKGMDSGMYMFNFDGDMGGA